MPRYKLDTLIRTTAEFLEKEDDLFQDGDSEKGAYLTDSDAKKLKKKIIRGINAALSFMSSDKALFIYTDEVSSDDDGRIDIFSLSYTPRAVISIIDRDDRAISNHADGEGYIITENKVYTNPMKVKYVYITGALKNDTDAFETEKDISAESICHYAAYSVLTAPGRDRDAKRGQFEYQEFQMLYGTIDGFPIEHRVEEWF